MSLQHAANHLAAHGRGPDTELVHMTKREINSLQELAKANGGSLTINPQTGLPEAGFLDSLLPAVIGGAAMYFSGGAINPATAGGLFGLGMPATIGLGVGALQTARTGSLKKGLMAGLGAYGGAGLAGGLMGSAAAQAVPEAVVSDAGIGASQAPAVTNAVSQGAVTGQALPSMPNYGLAPTAAGNVTSTAPGMGSMADRIAAAGKTASGMNPMLKYGLSAAAPMLAQTATPQPEIKSDGTPADKMVYNVGREVDAQGNPITPQPDVLGYGNQGQNFGRERNYFPNAGYTTPVVGQKRYATGGPVEQMSTANAVGANTGYPMADISQTTYATPYQTPTAQNVVAGAQDVAVDPYTGQEQRTVPAPSFRLAAGGEAKEDIGYKGYKKIPVYGEPSGGSDAPPQTAPNTRGSPTGSIVGDLAYYVAQQPLSPLAAHIAQGYTDSYSPTSSTSVNAVNGMDAASDAATAAGAGVPVSDGVATTNSYGSYGSADSSGDGSGGEANGGLAPHFPRHMARGGLSAAASHLGDYSDGGRLLRGPGDGVSDSIPAVIGKKRPARLADGEFVVPARIVSELGNGSTEAGARKLYAMLDRVQAARKKSIGKGKVAKNSRADKLLPA